VLRRNGPARSYVAIYALRTWRPGFPRLAAVPTVERAGFRGICEAGAWQITAGAIVAHAVMRTLDIGSMDVSPWALRAGIILHHLETVMHQEQPLSLDSLQPVEVLETVPANVTPMPIKSP
jgi:exopolyphosphatase / guanosine-5'-triphosphate,3'-diphosphate pyrophosphatase